MSNKAECKKLIEMIEEDHYESLSYFYKNLYEQLLDYIHLFESNKIEEDTENDE